MYFSCRKKNLFMFHLKNVFLLLIVLNRDNQIGTKTDPRNLNPKHNMDYNLLLTIPCIPKRYSIQVISELEASWLQWSNEKRCFQCDLTARFNRRRNVNRIQTLILGIYVCEWRFPSCTDFYVNLLLNTCYFVTYIQKCQGKLHTRTTSEMLTKLQNYRYIFEMYSKS